MRAHEPRFQALKNQYDARSIQIICNAGSEILFERFKARSESGNRHPGHGDEIVLTELHEFLSSDDAPLLAIGGPVVEVDTTDFSKVEYQEILEKVQSALLK